LKVLFNYQIALEAYRLLLFLLALLPPNPLLLILVQKTP